MTTGQKHTRLAVAASFGLALLVPGRLWAGPGAMLTDNRQDNVQFEWVLTNAVHTVRHLSDPFWTDLMNAPAGVNLMANTSIWGLALPLAPVTALLGAPVAFRVLLTLALFGTAVAWYVVLSRHVFASRVAAFVGAALCGFLPGMVGQDTGHPNIAAQFVLPFIVLVVLHLGEPGRTRRNGLVLAGLVTYQIFVNEEVLLLAALALGVFVGSYWIQRPDLVRPRLRGALASLAITAGVVAVVVAYPLYRQFLGAQSYHGLPGWVLDYSTDVKSYAAYAQQSLAGSKAGAEKLAQGVAEQNTFYGWGLLALVAGTVWWLRDRPAVRALAVVGAVFAVLSFGRVLIVGGENTGVPGPWALVSHLPLLDTVVPTRLSLVTVPVVGLLVGFFVERIMAGDGQVRAVGAAALAAALLPIAPTPLAVENRKPTPVFFATGAWRQHIRPGSTVGILPFGWEGNLTAMRIQTGQRLQFKIMGGYFLGPQPGSPDRVGQFGGLWGVVNETLDGREGNAAEVTDEVRTAARAELHGWGTDVLVLPDAVPNAGNVRGAADRILGPGAHVSDVTLWRV